MGQRVVVRRVVPGRRGPSGGPALTDVLGVLEAWTDNAALLRREDGTLVEVPRADIVAGKPVPPRRSVRLRVSAAEAEERAVASWPPLESTRIGEWLLRASAGFSARGNSALVTGDPDRDFSDALGEVVDYYAARGLPAWVQAVTGSPQRRRLDDLGWVTARPGEADTAFLLCGVARARRHLGRRDAASSMPLPVPVVSDRLTPDWLAGDVRATAAGDAARAVLEGPPEVAFARVPADALGDPAGGGAAPAVGRAALSRTASDTWVGITDVRVAPEHRRRGLASAVLEALLGWAAERGATTAYLQVREDNAAALTLYQRLGFERHHSYGYRRPPG